MQPRRVTHNIGDSKFIYGRPNERNALGVREGAVSNQIQYIPENLPLKSPLGSIAVKFHILQIIEHLYSRKTTIQKEYKFHHPF